MLKDSRFPRREYTQAYHAWVLGIQIFLTLLLVAFFYYYLWERSGYETPNWMISYFHALLGIFITASALISAIYFYQWKQVALQAVLCLCLMMEGLLLIAPVVWSMVFKHELLISAPRLFF